MKKALFYFAIIAAVVLMLRIIKILVYDFSRLTNYGFGHLTGLIIWFLIAILIAVFVKRKINLK